MSKKKNYSFIVLKVIFPLSFVPKVEVLKEVLFPFTSLVPLELLVKTPNDPPPLGAGNSSAGIKISNTICFSCICKTSVMQYTMECTSISLLLLQTLPNLNTTNRLRLWPIQPSVVLSNIPMSFSKLPFTS